MAAAVVRSRKTPICVNRQKAIGLRASRPPPLDRQGAVDMIGQQERQPCIYVRKTQ